MPYFLPHTGTNSKLLKGLKVMSNREQELYEIWCKKATADKDLIEELNSITGDNDAIEDRFYRDLEFGTGGLRGVIGAGTNRINIYTVNRATQGLANYLKTVTDKASVAISYDSRIKSDTFAKSAAAVLAANGIKAYIYKELMPTPLLSFATRELKCDAGIMVTASHNPAKYNGYKCYGPDGCQLTLDASEKVLGYINSLDVFDDIKTVDFDKALAEGMIEYIGDDMLEKFLDAIETQLIAPDMVRNTPLKVVYTPLNGTGNKPVRKILDRIGVKDVEIVKEQENPDGNFPTCPFPNPEIKEALALAIKLAEETNPDLVLATDPDCDRVGIAVVKDHKVTLITGNEVGALLTYYRLMKMKENGTLPEKPVIIKTIVSTGLAADIAKDFGAEIIDVLTGFKFIGEQMDILVANGHPESFILGFEESYGYLSGLHARDKDAVVGSMMICEMAAYYKSKNMTIVDALDELYAKYGRYLHTQVSFTCEGITGMQRMGEIMNELRTQPPKSVAGSTVVSIDDYLESKTTDTRSGSVTPIALPKSNVLSFTLENGASFIVRPSGTEPKIKVYINVKDKDLASCTEIEEQIKADVTKIMGF